MGKEKGCKRCNSIKTKMPVNELSGKRVKVVTEHGNSFYMTKKSK